jgi:hypothetical protein
MRRIVRNIVTVAVSVALGAAGLQAAKVYEDSPNFNCTKHGNRTCGVTLDPKPNNGKRDTVRVNLKFNAKGDIIKATVVK